MNMLKNYSSDVEALNDLVNKYNQLRGEIGKVIIGQNEVVRDVLISIFSQGHCLLVGVPGLAKTLLVNTISRVLGLSYNRIQFTPDLMPADITGFNVYDQKSGEFSFRPGPVITHVLLADEINRTIPRTQSSLLECMEERQVTVDGKTHPLPNPFFVMATQNPIELEGTFPLPEAQLDRFLLKIHLGYPEKDEEISILERFREDDPLLKLEAVASPEQVTELQQARKKIRVSLPIRKYITDIVRVTRNNNSVRFGASPRGSLGLMRTGQALAALRGRDYVLPDDIKYLIGPVLSHRLILKEEERLRGGTPEQILNEMVHQIPVPAPTT